MRADPVAARRSGRWALAGVVAITALAAALRLWRFGAVATNPFYDAAVRSMSGSWHRFFFGAFDPEGTLAIDKPPLDLWLQVASVKLLGYSSVALRLPAALAGIAAVPLLYDTIRRPFGRAGGLIAAAALAVLPVSVVAARSDTMDSLMMLVLALATWLCVRALHEERPALLWAAGAALGLAFNVKLFEALLPLPALALMARRGTARWPPRERARALPGAAVALVAVALSWMVVATLAPGKHPWPIGSSTGSVWDVVFVFNGVERLSPVATSAIAAYDPAGVDRLVRHAGPDYGGLIGVELLAAVVLAVGAAVTGRALHPAARAVAAGLVAWLATGVILLSGLGHVEARYLEAVSPAVAGLLGVATARLLAGGRGAVLVTGVTAAALLGVWVGRPGVPLALATAALCAVVAAIALARPRRRTALAVAATAALLLPAVGAAARQVGRARSVAGSSAVLPPRQVARISRYLSLHDGRAHYEAAAFNTFSASNLIARDGQPVLVLTSYAGREFTSTARLAQLIRAGEVRYALLYSGRCEEKSGAGSACSAVVEWAHAHAVDVSAEAGLPAPGILYRLTGA